jgi:conjugal transfer/type IV secretion protein DotA/TraY
VGLNSTASLFHGSDGTTCGNGTQTFQLGVRFSTGVDAMESLVLWGHNAVIAGLDTAGEGAIALGGSAISGKFAQWAGEGRLKSLISSFAGGLSALGTFLEAFALVFLLIGFPFAFILPMIPFIRFFFGAVVWLGQVVESVVAVPLVALAQLNPDGAGFAGNAKQGYIFAFSIFLRPVLMVFGLIAGWMIFIVAANFLTFAFGVAVVAFGGTNFGFQVVAKFGFTLIYVYVMYGCANKCFEMITHIPNNALDWMQAKGHTAPHGMNAADSLDLGKAALEGYVLKQGVGGIGKAATAIGKAVGEGSEMGEDAYAAKLGPTIPKGTGSVP